MHLKRSLKTRKLFLVLLLVAVNSIFSQNIPSNRVLDIGELAGYLSSNAKNEISRENISVANLASYFREKFSERYFYNWQNIDERFATYNHLYPNEEKAHTKDALDHLYKYPDSTQWVLPFNYQNGKPVNAYALRHLARQHKMVDIAFYYHYQNKDTQYLDYFKNQLKSLNVAFQKGEYEKIEHGNGVFEAFRSGYRILNWLSIHNMFLNEAAYTDADQLTTIATLLQHGAHLYERNAEFHAGNHQTRGLSALAMLSILLRDFEGTDKWYERAMNLLEQHLSKEINDDGFQFERTVHYHMSDIGNYYYVYQLAKISELDVKPFWKEKLKSLFITLTKIAYPDKSSPVLSDDTDEPWAEKNDISGAITLGYLLFDSAKMGYFSNKYVKPWMYWFVTDEQLKMLENIEVEIPTIKSVEFPETGYFIMREGWHINDKMMIVSAGLDVDKPDHQHGDMLGVQAMANGKVILPNYQVRYSLKDLELFKNSMTKNVALVDNELQGKQYTSNKGGSGFGKFRSLPNPEVITWKTNKNLDVFVGRHNGFEDVGVRYSRQVMYLKDDFWIVKDNFSSKTQHDYKQVWQGHYSLEESSNLIRSTFDNASGLDIYQLKSTDTVVSSGQRGKQWSVVSKKDQKDFSFITVLFPYQGYSNRIDETLELVNIKDWELNNSKWKIEGNQSISLSKEDDAIIFSVKKVEADNFKVLFSEEVDIYFKLKDKIITIQSLNDKQVRIAFKKGQSETLNPGALITYKIE